jgi:hypothetical protein
VPDTVLVTGPPLPEVLPWLLPGLPAGAALPPEPPQAASRPSTVAAKYTLICRMVIPPLDRVTRFRLEAGRVLGSTRISAA